MSPISFTVEHVETVTHRITVQAKDETEAIELTKYTPWSAMTLINCKPINIRVMTGVKNQEGAG